LIFHILLSKNSTVLKKIQLKNNVISEKFLPKNTTIFEKIQGKGKRAYILTQTDP